MPRRFLPALAGAASICLAATFQAAAPDAPYDSLPAKAANLTFNDDGIDMRGTLIGFRSYCDFYQNDCAELDQKRTDETIHLTPKMWTAIRRQYARASAGMTIREDFKKYPLDPYSNNAPDVWTHGEEGSGDCEDWTFMWDAAFRKLGVPRSALLKMLVSSDRKEYSGEGKTARVFSQKHMILVLRTNLGSFVADMNTQKLTPLEDLDKEWSIVRVESPNHAMSWVTASLQKQKTEPAVQVGANAALLTPQ